MIVGRWTWTMKPKNVAEWTEVIKGTEKWFAPRTTRTYKSGIGNGYGTLAAEVEFESLADYEEFWAQMVTKPEFAPVMEKFRELAEDGITRFWELVE